MNWKNWKPWPGMAVRDPDTGRVWRRQPHGWAMDVAASDTQRKLTNFVHDAEFVHPSIARALAAGPDADDDMTVLGLLADLPGHQLRREGRWTDPRETGATEWVWEWSARDEKGSGEWHPTRKAAIIAAWQAVHGGER